MLLTDFIPTEKIIQRTEPILKDDFINPYWFMNYLIGYFNMDFTVFKLVRTSKNFTTRKYPRHTQISREIIIDLFYRKKTRKILIEIDGKIRYWTTPATWLNKGMGAKLTPEQEDQLFLHLNFIHEVRR